jgi:nucleoside phosphorylase
VERVDVVVLAALGWEARVVAEVVGTCARIGANVWRGVCADGASCLVVRTGVGPARAREAADAAPPAGVFVSTGCAGGLSDAVRCGDLVAATSVVVLGAGGGAERRLEASGAAVAARMAAGGQRVQAGAIASSAHVLTTVEDKARAAGTGAIAVDMESGAIAEVAAWRGIPFVGLRAILDEAGDVLPSALLSADASGEPRVLAMLARAAVRPWTWSVLGRLGRQQRAATAALRAGLTALLVDGAPGLAPVRPAVVT